MKESKNKGKLSFNINKSNIWILFLKNLRRIKNI